MRKIYCFKFFLYGLYSSRYTSETELGERRELKYGTTNFAQQMGVGLLIYCSWHLTSHFFAESRRYPQNVQFLNINVFFHVDYNSIL